MTWTPPPPTKPPQEYLWADPPQAVLAATRETGISDTQFIALWRSIIKQTHEELDAGNPVCWRLVGRWEPRPYSRETYPKGPWLPEVEGGEPVDPGEIEKEPMVRASFRPRWRPAP